MNLIEKIIRMLRCCRKNKILDDVIEIAEESNIILHK